MKTFRKFIGVFNIVIGVILLGIVFMGTAGNPDYSFINLIRNGMREITTSKSPVAIVGVVLLVANIALAIVHIILASKKKKSKSYIILPVIDIVTFLVADFCIINKNVWDTLGKTNPTMGAITIVSLVFTALIFTDLIVGFIEGKPNANEEVVERKEKSKKHEQPKDQNNGYVVGANDIVLNISVGPAGSGQTQRIILNGQNNMGVPTGGYVQQPYQQPYQPQMNQNVNVDPNQIPTSMPHPQNIEPMLEQKPQVEEVHSNPNVNKNYNDDDEEDNTRQRGTSLDSLLAPTKVHAPASRRNRNVGREALESMEPRRPEPLRSESGIGYARTEQDDAAESAAESLSKSVDLSTFGIDLTQIKTEEDYKEALQKILGNGPATPQQPAEFVDEEEEPDENDLDYELQQIEDSDLNDNELRELKYIIGDPSNMTFIEKFEKADDDLRKKYLKLRYKLLSSKEKRLTSRITRYFDTYYWRDRIIARITIQGKTIKLFLALNPKDYQNTRFSVSDESSKLIYRQVPTLLRVRTDLSYAKGKKLISDLLNKKESDIYEAPEIKFEEKKVAPVEPTPAPAPVVEVKPAPVEETKSEEVKVESPLEETKPEEVKEEVKTEETSVTETTAEQTKETDTEVVEEVHEEPEEDAVEKAAAEEEPTEEKEVKDDSEELSVDEDIEEEREPRDEEEVTVSEEASSDEDDVREFELDEFGNEVSTSAPKPSDDDELKEEDMFTNFDEENEEDLVDKEELAEYERKLDAQINGEDDEDEFESDAHEDDESDEGDEDEDEDGESKPKNPNPFANFQRGTGVPVVRKTFAEKIVEGEPSMKEQYSELKSLLISYGMKSRIAKSNETFRFKKELFAKITVQGKSLKLYLALNPEDYHDSKFPIKDVSDKKAYEQVPLLMKIRSNLSFKRGKILIEELMAKKGILQGIYTDINYAELLEIGLE